ncbi:MAG: thioesterase [Oscillospiraceae bacterium]|nr:thioesterase [Oscillospiraceae bacterium]
MMDSRGASQAEAALACTTRKFSIFSTQCDMWDKVQAEALFAMMQEVASDNAVDNGYGYVQLDPQGLVWLLSRSSLRMQSYPGWGDDLYIRTWCRKVERLFYMRDFELSDGQGRLWGAATTAWFLSDKSTHKPERADRISSQQQTFVNPEAVLPFDAVKLRNASVVYPDSPQIKKYADFSDIDRNRHVNNTRYVAWVADCFYAAKGLQHPHAIIGLDINFVSELHAGDEVFLYGAEALASSPTLASEIERPEISGYFDVEGRNRDGLVCFKARLHYN